MNYALFNQYFFIALEPLFHQNTRQKSLNFGKNNYLWKAQSNSNSAPKIVESQVENSILVVLETARRLVYGCAGEENNGRKKWDNFTFFVVFSKPFPLDLLCCSMCRRRVFDGSVSTYSYCGARQFFHACNAHWSWFFEKSPFKNDFHLRWRHTGFPNNRKMCANAWKSNNCDDSTGRSRYRRIGFNCKNYLDV